MKLKRNPYWNKFYSKFSFSKESNFAKFCIKFFKKNSCLLDVGCGNGRDTFFFIKNGIKCKGIDISKTAIKNNSKRLKNTFEVKDACSNQSKNQKNMTISIVDSFYILLIRNQKKIFLETLKKL